MTISDTRRVEIIRDLNRMKLELDTCYDYLRELAKVQNINNPVYLKRNGSIRGRQNHVQNVLQNLRRVETDQQVGGVIVYLTSCGVLRHVYENCKLAVQLLELHRIKYRVEDLNIDTECGHQLEQKLGMSKNAILENLPMIFINQKLLGTYKNLVELNDQGWLTRVLRRYQTEKLEVCQVCSNRGYVICRHCHGSHRNVSMLLSLRCAHCDVNGIVRCPACKIVARPAENRAVG